jgi:hypothetical protein
VVTVTSQVDATWIEPRRESAEVWRLLANLVQLVVGKRVEISIQRRADKLFKELLELEQGSPRARQPRGVRRFDMWTIQTHLRWRMPVPLFAKTEFSMSFDAMSLDPSACANLIAALRKAGPDAVYWEKVLTELHRNYDIVLGDKARDAELPNWGRPTALVERVLAKR